VAPDATALADGGTRRPSLVPGHHKRFSGHGGTAGMDRATRRQAVGVATLALAAAVGAIWLSPGAVARRLAALGDRPAVFLAVLCGLYLVRPVLAWPISAVSALVGFVVGPAGVPLALGGAVVTCLPPYLLARASGETGPLGRAGEYARAYVRTAGALRGVIAARLAPLPADPVSYAAGLARVPPAAYALGTALGELPWVVAAVLVGASAESVVTAGTSALPLVGGAAALATLLLAGPAYRRLRGEPVGR